MNELAVWRVTRDGVRKELVWRPPSPWADAVATWKNAETLTIDYMPAGREPIERRAACGPRLGAPIRALSSPVHRPWPRHVSHANRARRPAGAGRASRRRPIRSFVLRQGRLSPAQERALDSLWPAFGVPYADSPLDFDLVFGRRAPRVLDIGFGMGETTATIARLARTTTFSASTCTVPGSAACSNGSPTAASPTCG